jgi:polysaccharide pyruvyl transferase WcaK-like protein/glycosyltransferase involved in cell wall biosynthesis
MKHLLICGAAGFTNRGDDAILWGMLTQLRARFGERPIEVVGGPELAALCEPFDAQARRYEDRSELARAIEDAALVILGGGGLLYDHDYDVSLARLLTDPPDRQWLYEVAKLASAARAAGRPAMLYGMGVGPLVSEAGRRVARYIGESVQAIAVRDQDSAEALASCGVPVTRIEVAADPAVLVDPGPRMKAQEFARRSGLAGRPRPWIGLNLRPWYRFMGVEGEPGAADRLVAEAGKLIDALRTRLRGTVVLLPLQSLYDDDATVLRGAMEVAGEDGVVLADTPAAPPDAVAALGQLDVMVGMRMHACLLALNARVPFVSLAYSPKVAALVQAAGLSEFSHAIDELRAEPVAASCERLIAWKARASRRLAESRDRLCEQAQLSLELAAQLVERPSPLVALAPRGEEEGDERPAGPLLSPLSRPEGAPLRVLMQIRPDFREKPGGDVVQLEAMLPYLGEMGVTAELTGEVAPDLSGYDLIHTINLDRPEEPYRHCLNALSQDKPIALSTVHTDLSEFYQWVSPEYWVLPEPGEGDPEPRPAPPPEPVEARRRAREHLQRQAIIDWSSSYLPNAQMNAEYLHEAFGLDLTRTVLVPNAVLESCFDPSPDLFVSKHGLRDFVLCVGRIEAKKNQLGLVAALRGQGIPLVLVGSANPPEYLELCRRYADENVHFLDRMSEEELASAYAAAKVHALASWVELPGLTSLEAAAAGCNIVSTDRGSPPEYFGDLAWYCDPCSVESIRQAVRAAYEAPRSGRLRERMQDRYTWRGAAKATVAGYRLALAVHAATSSEDRRRAWGEAAKRHNAWLERLAADRLYEIQRRDERVGALENWAHGLEARAERLEEILADCRGEIDRITARRSYRWTSAAAQGIWGILKRLGVSR